MRKRSVFRDIFNRRAMAWIAIPSDRRSRRSGELMRPLNGSPGRRVDAAKRTSSPKKIIASIGAVAGYTMSWHFRGRGS
ncbi:hypothetical protein KZ829_08290 [Actinoplanes hulinensis]|uniref:Uncharacterized protein n=1 Tax=Actinoplanes hulinensis TaxID=1144547 RepID=A0ABS7AYA1_9ACTN|nr:hypothetical protein [Actinoplanes hulinensis]MBW6433741.1 hypothetical protein [Actinoplanes hulinensis]